MGIAYITTCCGLVFIGMNHSPEKDGVCRNCGKEFGYKKLKVVKQ